MIKKIVYKMEYVILIAALILIWIIADKTGKLNTIVMPAPFTVFETLVLKCKDGSLFEAIGISVSRVLKGFGWSALLGTILGIVIGLSSHAKRLTDMLIQIIKPIPPIAWIPLVILWIGIGEASKVFLIFLGGFFVILINVIDGIRYNDVEMTEVANVLGVSKIKYILMLVIPGALPSIFTGFRVGINSCWTCVVAAELVASSSGIGYLISNARNYGQMDVVLVGMLAIGIVGKIMDVFLKILEKKIVHWI